MENADFFDKERKIVELYERMIQLAGDLAWIKAENEKLKEMIKTFENEGYEIKYNLSYRSKIKNDN